MYGVIQPIIKLGNPGGGEHFGGDFGDMDSICHHLRGSCTYDCDILEEGPD